MRTKLQDSDLCRSHFEECNFTDAELQGAKMTREQGKQIRLSNQQQRVIDWQQFPACDFRPENRLVPISSFANSLRIMLS